MVCIFLLDSISHFTALAVLELAVYTRVALNLQGSVCLCLSSVGIKGVHHYLLVYIFKKQNKTWALLLFFCFLCVQEHIYVCALACVCVLVRPEQDLGCLFHFLPYS